MAKTLTLEQDVTKNMIAHCGNHYIRCPFEHTCSFQIHSTKVGKIVTGCQLEEAYQFFDFLSQLDPQRQSTTK